MNLESAKERRRTVRIPVTAVLPYRAVGMGKFEMCHVSSVSTLSLEMLLDHVLPETTVVTISVRSEDPIQRYHHVVGQITRVQKRKGKWMHVVAASTQRPWSPLFLYDVVCSTFNPAVQNPAETTESKPQFADLEEWFDLIAWEPTVNPARPIGLERVDDQALLMSAWPEDIDRVEEPRWAGIPHVVN